MTPDRRSPSPKSALGSAAIAVAACAACCIGPVLSVLGGIGAASAIGAVWVPALAVVTLAALIAVVWVRRHRRAANCDTGRRVVDLGMPARAVPRTDADPAQPSTAS